MESNLNIPKNCCRWELKCCKLILNGLWEISIVHTISWKTQRLEQQFPTATILLPNFPNEWKTLTFPKTACRWELKCCKLILNGLWEISIIHTIFWKFQRLEQQFPMATILIPNFPIEWKGSRILSVLCKERSFAGTKKNIEQQITLQNKINFLVWLQTVKCLWRSAHFNVLMFVKHRFNF